MPHIEHYRLNVSSLDLASNYWYMCTNLKGENHILEAASVKEVTVSWATVIRKHPEWKSRQLRTKEEDNCE